MHMTRDVWIEWSALRDIRLDIGLMNYTEVQAEKRRQRRRLGLKPPFLDNLRLSDPEHVPVLILPGSFHPDFFTLQGSHFVSAKLFKLLDCPKGTIQDIQTEITWLEDHPPNAASLWLSFIPRYPAIDFGAIERRNEAIRCRSGGETHRSTQSP
jgi:hypothetical protein